MATGVSSTEKRRACHNFSINNILDLGENTSNRVRPAGEDDNDVENAENKLITYSTGGRKEKGSWPAPLAASIASDHHQQQQQPPPLIAARLLRGSGNTLCRTAHATAHTVGVVNPATATVAVQPTTLPTFIATGYVPQRQQQQQQQQQQPGPPPHLLHPRQILTMGVPAQILPAFTWGPAPACNGDWGGRRRRKSRTVFTSEQLLLLEKRFEESRYLSMTDRFEIARKLGLSEQQIKTWFQNRRTKWKKCRSGGSGELYEGSSEVEGSDPSLSPPVHVLSP